MSGEDIQEDTQCPDRYVGMFYVLSPTVGSYLTPFCRSLIGSSVCFIPPF